MKRRAASASLRVSRIPETERSGTTAQRDSTSHSCKSSADHFCPRLSLIAPWPSAKCEACDGRATSQQLDALKSRARGGDSGGYELTRSRRLAHALVLFK